MEKPYLQMGWFGGKTHYFQKHPYGFVLGDLRSLEDLVRKLSDHVWQKKQTTQRKELWHVWDVLKKTHTHTTGGFFFEGVSKDVNSKNYKLIRPFKWGWWELSVPSSCMSHEILWLLHGGLGFFMLLGSERHEMPKFVGSWAKMFFWGLRPGRVHRLMKIFFHLCIRSGCSSCLKLRRVFSPIVMEMKNDHLKTQVIFKGPHKNKKHNIWLVLKTHLVAHLLII